jgi:hypothetical protein
MSNSQNAGTDNLSSDEEFITIVSACVTSTVATLHAMCMASFLCCNDTSSSSDEDDESTSNIARRWTGAGSAEAILNGPGNTCYNAIRMHKGVFLKLRDLVQRNGYLGHSRGLTLEEQLVIFLNTISHHVKNRMLQHHFNHSGETISRHFNRVLDAIIKLHPILLKPPELGVAPQIMNTSRFYPYFKDCIGALDGTHIPAMVSRADQQRWRNRKGFISQNVLAACSFDGKFTYVLAGWEGSAADARILSDALSRSNNSLVVPANKYYLVDAGFPNIPGFLAPYRGCRYHLKEFVQGLRPRNKQELFNHRHASLRNSIERAFGVVKQRFPILKCAPSYPINTQVKMVIACFIIHNHIASNHQDDPLLNETINAEDDDDDNTDALSHDVVSSGPSVSRREREAWNMFRETIAENMWRDYNETND